MEQHKLELTLEEMVEVDSILNDYGINPDFSDEVMNSFVERIRDVGLQSMFRTIQVPQPSISVSTKQYKLEIEPNE